MRKVLTVYMIGEAQAGARGDSHNHRAEIDL